MATLIIGKVGRPHGLRGAFFVVGRDSEIPKAYADLRIGATPEAAQRATITSSYMQGDRPVLVCSLAGDRNTAESLTGQWIYIDAATAKAKTKGNRSRGVDVDDELLWGELPGATVVDSAGLALGTIENVYNAGASDVIEIRDAGGRTLDLPLIADYLSGGVRRAGNRAELHLTVPAEVFDELWQDVKKPREPKAEPRKLSDPPPGPKKDA